MSSARKVILIADGDEIFRDQLEDALTQENYEVIATGDEAGALELLEEFPMLDLLLLALDLPGGDPWSLLERIKRDTASIDVAVFAIAQEVTPDDIARLRDLNVEGVLERSDDMAEPMYRVNAHLFPSGRDRRTSPRALARGPCSYKALDESFHGMLWNISTTGAFIRTDYPLAPDTRVQMEFSLPGAPRPIRCTGYVARVVVTPQSAGPGEVRGIGIKFSTISPADTMLIREFVESQLRVN